MQPYQPIVMAALIMSILSTTLSIIALWPHLKDRLSVVRDAVLWIAVAAVAFAMFLSYQKRTKAEWQGYESNTIANFLSPPPVPDVQTGWSHSQWLKAPSIEHPQGEQR
jgi:hypothetical protein